MIHGGALVRAIRGPVMLIALGVLMAIDHAGTMSFSRTWPALIILFGVMKLGERVLSPGHLPPPPTVPPAVPMSGGVEPGSGYNRYGGSGL